jgi:hypothetical protein
MDKPISVGDLVMIVSGCCDHHSRGVPYKVERFGKGRCVCVVCGKGEHYPKVAVGDGYSVPVEHVKRIPPLEELDEVRTEDEVTA